MQFLTAENKLSKDKLSALKVPLVCFGYGQAPLIRPEYAAKPLLVRGGSYAAKPPLVRGEV